MGMEILLSRDVDANLMVNGSACMVKGTGIKPWRLK